MFQNLRVKNKIFLLSFSLIFFILIISFGAYENMSYLNSELHSMYENNLKAIQWLNDNKNEAQSIQANTYYLILRKGIVHDKQSRLEAIQESLVKYQENLEKFKKTHLDQYEKS